MRPRSDPGPPFVCAVLYRPFPTGGAQFTSINHQGAVNWHGACCRADEPAVSALQSDGSQCLAVRGTAPIESRHSIWQEDTPKTPTTTNEGARTSGVTCCSWPSQRRSLTTQRRLLEGEYGNPEMVPQGGCSK